MFSLILRVYEITRNNTAVSLVVITTIIPNILIGALAGVLVDRMDRKIVMFFAHFLRVFAVLTFLISSESLVWIYLMTIIVGTITQFFSPAEGATIPELIKDKTLLLTANSLFTLTFLSTVVIGNVLAGPFLAMFGAQNTFIIVACAFLVASIFTAKIPGPSVINPKNWHFKNVINHGGLLHNFLEGMDFLHKHPTVRRYIYIMAIGQLMIAILGSIAPGFADKILHLGVADVSIFIMAPAAAGMILGAFMAGQFFAKADRQSLVRVGFISAGTVLLVFSQLDRIAGLLSFSIIPITIITLMSLGFSNAFLEVPINTLVQENTPEEVRSRVYGVISSIAGTASIIPVFLAGAIADTFGVRAVMFITAFTLFIMSVYNIKRSKK